MPPRGCKVFSGFLPRRVWPSPIRVNQGQGAGAPAESLANLDENQLPYVPVSFVNTLDRDLELGDVVPLNSLLVGFSATDYDEQGKVIVAQERIPRGLAGQFAWAGAGVRAKVYKATTPFIGEWVALTDEIVNLRLTATGLLQQVTTPRTSNLLAPRGSVGIVTADWDATTLIATITLLDRPAETFDPPTMVSFFEDFFAADASAAAGAGAIYNYQHPWSFVGQTPERASLGGVARVASDGVNIGSCNYPRATVVKLFNVSQNLALHVRWAQVGAGAGTRRIGLASASPIGAAAEPATGLYFRHTASGNIIIVFRNGGVDLVAFDTGIAAAAGVFHTGIIYVTNGNTVQSIVDGAYISGGSLSFDPALFFTADLLVGAGVSVVTNGVGLDVDYIGVDQQR